MAVTCFHMQIAMEFSAPAGAPAPKASPWADSEKRMESFKLLGHFETLESSPLVRWMGKLRPGEGGPGTAQVTQRVHRTGPHPGLPTSSPLPLQHPPVPLPSGLLTMGSGIPLSGTIVSPRHPSVGPGSVKSGKKRPEVSVT